MNVHHTSLHLDGNEPIRGEAGRSVDRLIVGDEFLDGLTLVLGHDIAPADRIRFLRELSEAASDLAHEITLRDLEAAS